jgi:hypothetical protein
MAIMNERTCWPQKCSVSKGLSTLARDTRGALYLHSPEIASANPYNESKLWIQTSAGKTGMTKNGEAL